MRNFLILILVSFSFVIANPIAQHNTQFYFAQITDTHWGDGNHLEFTKEAVDMIKSFPGKIEFIAHTGDLTARTVLDSNSLDSGLIILRSANIPLYFVAGNHDLSRNDSMTFKVFQTKVGPFLTSAKYHEVNVVFACTEPLAASFSINGYSPVSELTALLDKIKNTPTLLFVHSTPCPDFYNNSFHVTWSQTNKKSFENMIENSSVNAIIAGHFHRNDFFWIGNCPVYISPSIAGYFGREASFRIFEYNNGKLSIISEYVH